MDFFNFKFIYIIMLKKFADYIDQEELDRKLFQSIDNNDYNTFTTVIKKGANVNQVIPDESGRPGYTKSPLTQAIYGWRHSERDRFKFLKVLFDAGVNLFDYIGHGPEPFDIDIYSSINKLVSAEYRQRIIDYLIEKYPTYMEEREIRKDSDKYNL